MIQRIGHKKRSDSDGHNPQANQSDDHHNQELRRNGTKGTRPPGMTIPGAGTRRKLVPIRIVGTSMTRSNRERPVLRQARKALRTTDSACAETADSARRATEPQEKSLPVKAPEKYDVPTPSCMPRGGGREEPYFPIGLCFPSDPISTSALPDANIHTISISQKLLPN